MRQKYLPIVCILFIIWGGVTHADGWRSAIIQCKASLHKKDFQKRELDNVFKKSYSDESVYSPGHCYTNVIRLFREFPRGWSLSNIEGP